MKVTSIIKVYSSEYYGDGNVFFKIASVVNGIIGSFHPMAKTDRESLSLSLDLNLNGNCQLVKDKNIDILELKFAKNSITALSFIYRFNDSVTLRFKDMEPFKVKLPEMYVTINGKDVHLYFIERKGKRRSVHVAVLPNVSSNGSLCLGSSKFPSLSGSSLNVTQLIHQWMQMLFENTFVHPSMGSIESLEEMKELLITDKYKTENYYAEKKELSKEISDCF